MEAVKVGTILLSNGVKLPRFGLGTWLGGSVNDDELEKQKIALRIALEAGYRYIDTAFRYQNEQLIGEVLQEFYDAGKLKRSDIFITSKLPFFGHSEPDYFLQKSLKALKTNYIDLYLLHTPLPTKRDGDNFATDSNGKIICDISIPLIETWRFLEFKYKSGILKAIGVSNFNNEQIQDLYDQAEIKPHNLQVELHILHQQRELLALCKKLNISVTSYGTLGSPGSHNFRDKTSGDCLGYPLVVELAKKYNKTPAQVLLRNYVQQGISVIPKSLTPKRIQENINIFDFEIDNNDINKLNEIIEEAWLFKFNFLRHHPWFPFHHKEKKEQN